MGFAVTVLRAAAHGLDGLAFRFYRYAARLGWYESHYSWGGTAWLP